MTGILCGSSRDVRHSTHPEKRNAGATDVENVVAFPAYSKSPTQSPGVQSIAAVENAFHLQYQEHKERLNLAVFEGLSAYTPTSQKQRQKLHEQQRKLMAIHFQGLRDSKPADRPLFLNGINQLRHPTQVYTADAGASLKLGETWKFEQHGPYPSLRLASFASQTPPSDYIQAELLNADRAIQSQTDLDKNGGTYQGLAAYTDNLSFLKTARLYFGSAYAQRDWRGTGIEELERIGERTAKRIRM